MDPFVEVKISLDVNSASMPMYRVEIESTDGPIIATGYSLEEACRDALRRLSIARSDS